eukprot:scaffold158109_cov31-Tisochrysis_lutea.AAC.1
MSLRLLLIASLPFLCSMKTGALSSSGLSSFGFLRWPAVRVRTGLWMFGGASPIYRNGSESCQGVFED